MVSRPVISSLWIGDRLSYLEQLCLTSFLVHGHKVKLYAYDDIANVPKDVELADASSILPDQEVFYTKSRGSPAATADKFRYHLLEQTDEIWVDCDAYCVRPLPNTPYIFADERETVIANGVLRLPKNSPSLANLLEFCSTDYVRIPEDMAIPRRNETWVKFAADSRKEPVHIADAPWGAWGPRILSYYLNKNEEAQHAWPSAALYPVKGKDAMKLITRGGSNSLVMDLNCYSVHLFGSNLRMRLKNRPMFKNREPLPGSFVAERLSDHGIDPKSAPLL